MSLAEVLKAHHAVVCVGTGGVGKTTLAAAMAVAGAIGGRRTMVLTIDPARQLARALGLAALRREAERVPIATRAPLLAGMLDQKAAWDAFMTRHAPNPAVRRALLENPFYQRLSTSFAGSTELMAIEEMCRLDESGAHDLIVIDTPPAGHAVDFVRAPDRIERLLHPEVARWMSRPSRLLRHFERAMGTHTLDEIAAFFIALDAVFGDLAGRAERARRLLRSERTAFVLVVSPKDKTLAGSRELASTMRSLGVPIRAVVVNRVHPLPAGVTEAEARAAIGAAAPPPPVRSWLEETWTSAERTARAEQALLRAFRPPDTPWVEVPELPHDAHSLEDLTALARLMGLV